MYYFSKHTEYDFHRLIALKVKVLLQTKHTKLKII
jgi:hypothetical protein